MLSLGLIALVGGMILLSKTRKDSLGGFFKFVSWFVIFCSFAVIVFAIGTGMCRGFRHCCNKGYGYEKCEMKGQQGMMCCMKDGKMCMMKCCEAEKDMGCMEKEKIGCGQEKSMMCAGNDMDKMTPEQKADNNVKMLTEKLKLTTEQIPKVKEIFLKCVQTCEMNMKAAGGDKVKCDMMCGKACKDRNEALKKVLTPEQMKNLPACCVN